MSSNCTHCGAPLRDGAQFCAKCGKKAGDSLVATWVVVGVLVATLVGVVTWAAADSRAKQAQQAAVPVQQDLAAMTPIVRLDNEIDPLAADAISEFLAGRGDSRRQADLMAQAADISLDQLAQLNVLTLRSETGVRVSDKLREAFDLRWQGYDLASRAIAQNDLAAAREAYDLLKRSSEAFREVQGLIGNQAP